MHLGRHCCWTLDNQASTSKCTKRDNLYSALIQEHQTAVFLKKFIMQNDKDDKVYSALVEDDKNKVESLIKLDIDLKAAQDRVDKLEK